MGTESMRPHYVAVYSSEENGEPITSEFEDWKEVSAWLQEKWTRKEVDEFQLKIYSLEEVNPQYIRNEFPSLDGERVGF